MGVAFVGLVAIAGVAVIVIALLCVYVTIGRRRRLAAMQAYSGTVPGEPAFDPDRTDSQNTPDIDYEALYQYYNPQPNANVAGVQLSQQQQQQRRPYTSTVGAMYASADPDAANGTGRPYAQNQADGSPPPVMPATVIATQQPGRAPPRSARYFPEAQDPRLLPVHPHGSRRSRRGAGRDADDAGHDNDDGRDAAQVYGPGACYYASEEAKPEDTSDDVVGQHDTSSVSNDGNDRNDQHEPVPEQGRHAGDAQPGAGSPSSQPKKKR